MIPLQENPTLAIRLGPMAESRLYKIAHPAIFCDLSFVCLIQNSNRPHYWTTPLSNQISAKFLNRPLFFTSDTPHNQILASSGLSESCPKIGDVPKFPFHTVAALVPSAGTITLQIELHSDACAISARPLLRPRAACGARPLIERKPPSRHSIRRPDRKGPGIRGPQKQLSK
jgi:hypothetical protein